LDIASVYLRGGWLLFQCMWQVLRSQATYQCQQISYRGWQRKKNIIILRCVENYKVQTKLGDLALP
jgi:hypothetical protein